MNANTTQSGFYLLSDNMDAFIARFALATSATQTLDIQYYIMHSDASGEYLAYAILSAADRGVRVRILVDDFNIAGRDNSLKMLGQHENINIRIFNPMTNRDWFRNIEMIFNLNRAGRRMHNKVFIADNSAAIIGGRNIGDEYFDNRDNLSFIDLDLLTVGPVITDITQSFNEFWQSPLATPIESLSKATVIQRQLIGIRTRLKDKWSLAKNSDYFQSLQQSGLTKKIINKQIPYIWADANVFYDKPEKIGLEATNIAEHFGPRVSSYSDYIKKDLLIASPYFVPGNKAAHWLTEKSLQGINIRVLTNSLSTTDVIVVHAGYRRYRERLLRAGVFLFELKSTAQTLRAKTKKLIKGSSISRLHAKYMVIDQHYVFIGSANFDPRSNALNTEIGIMIESQELAAQTIELFNRTVSPQNCYQLAIDDTTTTNAQSLIWQTQENAKAIYFTDEPKASWRKKIGVFIASLLPIENLL